MNHNQIYRNKSEKKLWCSKRKNKTNSIVVSIFRFLPIAIMTLILFTDNLYALSYKLDKNTKTLPTITEPIEEPWVYSYTRPGRPTVSGFGSAFQAEQVGMNEAYGQNSGTCGAPLKIGDDGYPSENFDDMELRNTTRGAINVPKYDDFQLADYNSKSINVRYFWPGSGMSCNSAEDSLWIEKERVNKCPIGFEKVGTLCQQVHKDEPQKCDKEIGNPINVATGTKFHKEDLDLHLQPFEFALNYSSSSANQTEGERPEYILGKGWSHTYSKSISGVFLVDGVENMFVQRDDLSQLHFIKTNGIWQNKSYSGEMLEFVNSQWKLTTENNQIEKYNIFGQLTSIGTNGNVVTLEYQNGFSLLNKIITDDGKTVDIEYEESSDRISQITNTAGEVWSFNYTNVGALKTLGEITYPDLTTKIFHYENSSHNNRDSLTGITDRNGNRYASYEYDSDGKTIHEWHHAQDANGTEIKVEELTIDYHADNTRTITNSRGEISTYIVENNNDEWQIKEIIGPGCSNCSNANTSYVYYPVSNDLLSKTVDGKTTEYGDYDSKGQYGYKIEAAGTPEQRRTEYNVYDAHFFNKPLTITEPSVHTGSNKVTSYSYDNYANLLSISITGFTSDGTVLPVNTTTYEYNGPYNQISLIDGSRTDVNDHTVFEYYPDAESEGNNRGRLKRMTNAVGIVLRDGIQYSATGKILSELKPNGLNTSYSYNANTDRLETVTTTDSTKTIAAYTDYLASGEIKEIIKNYNTTDASKLTLSYDNAHRLIKVTDQQGNYLQYTLDTEGNQLAEETYDLSGLKKAISQVFDDYDRVDTNTQSGVTTNFDYGSDGNLYLQTNGNNVATEYDYDALSRLTQITQDLTTATVPTANTITQFEYDTQDRVKKVTDANGHNTLYDYDDLGRLTSLTSPDTGVDTFIYDPAGNVLSKTDANGNLTSFSYDANNRLTSVDYVGDDLDVIFNYDETGSGFSNGINQLTSFSDSKSQTILQYDAFGNLIDKKQEVIEVTPGNNIMQNIAYNYDASNRLQSLEYPSGLIVNYHYNNLDQVESIDTILNGQAIDVVNNLQYLPFGPLQSMDMGNGLSYTSNYDDGYRLNSFNYGPNYSAVYSYDNNHNITHIAREQDNSASYQYDRLERLTFDDAIYLDLSYEYDKLGNRTSETRNQCTLANSSSNKASTSALDPPGCNNFITINDYNYDANSNKLLSIGGGKQRGYDSNGNTLTTKNKAHRFSYNTANRMASYRNELNVLRAEYYYNGTGQRIYKKFYNNNSVPIYFTFQYNANGQMLSESKYKNNSLIQKWSNETIWLNNRPVAQVRTTYNNSGVVTSTNIYYILSDHLNTPRKATDATGTVLWSWNSDAFGTILANEDVDGDSNAFVFNLRFPGQFFDSESNQHYNYYRDYEPSTGRYLESDPIGLDGGLNTFVYVGGNPLIYIDEQGLNCKYGGICPPPPTPKERCEARCTWLSVGVCSAAGFGAGKKPFAICMAITGLETAGGSAPACGLVGFVAGMPITKLCRNRFVKICKKQNNCCDK
jgi:RHS repeat-associated protein